MWGVQEATVEQQLHCWGGMEQQRRWVDVGGAAAEVGGAAVLLRLTSSDRSSLFAPLPGACSGFICCCCCSTRGRPFRLLWDVADMLGYVMVEVLLAVLAMVGNVLVCWAMLLNSNLRTVTNLFLVSLAVADIAVGLLAIPFAIIIRWGGTSGLLSDLDLTFCSAPAPALESALTSSAASSWPVSSSSSPRAPSLACWPSPWTAASPSATRSGQDSSSSSTGGSCFREEPEEEPARVRVRRLKLINQFNETINAW